jgi:ABC-2 type transport system permease protein
VLNYVDEPAILKDEIIKTEAGAVVINSRAFEANMLQKKYPEINVYLNTSNVLIILLQSDSINFRNFFSRLPK